MHNTIVEARIENGKIECASVSNSIDATVQETDNADTGIEQWLMRLCTIEKRLILMKGCSGARFPQEVAYSLQS